MTNLPDPIETEHTSNEGFDIGKTHDELFTELIDKFNQLLAYMREREGIK